MLTPCTVRSYCELWLGLRSQTLALGEAWGFVMIHCLLIATLMAMTGCFGLLSAIQMGLTRRIISTAATIIVTSSIINSIASQADHAVRSVLSPF